MTLNRTISIAKRIIKQIIKDRRSLAMIFISPVVVMGLIGANFNNNQEVLNFIAPALIGTFVLFFTFILTNINRCRFFFFTNTYIFCYLFIYQVI